LLFDMIGTAHERSSVILTTNLAFENREARSRLPPGARTEAPSGANSRVGAARLAGFRGAAVDFGGRFAESQRHARIPNRVAAAGRLRVECPPHHPSGKESVDDESAAGPNPPRVAGARRVVVLFGLVAAADRWYGLYKHPSNRYRFHAIPVALSVLYHGRATTTPASDRSPPTSTTPPGTSTC